MSFFSVIIRAIPWLLFFSDLCVLSAFAVDFLSAAADKNFSHRFHRMEKRGQSQSASDAAAARSLPHAEREDYNAAKVDLLLRVRQLLSSKPYSFAGGHRLFRNL